MADNPVFSKEQIEQLRRTFFSQAFEILEDIQDAILLLEMNPDNDDVLKKLKRYFHTMKGDSDSLGLGEVKQICHRAEDVLALCDEGNHAAGTELVSLLLKCADVIDVVLNESEADEELSDIKGLIGEIDAYLMFHNGNVHKEKENNESQEEDFGLFRVDDSLADSNRAYRAEIVFHQLCEERGVGAFMIGERLNGIGELISASPDINSELIESSDGLTLIFRTDMKESDVKKALFVEGVTAFITIEPMEEDKIEGKAEKREINRKSGILRVESEKVDRIMDLAGELIIDRSVFEQIAKDIDSGIPQEDLAAKMFALNNHIGKRLSDLQKGIMRMRMVRIDHVFRKMPRILRDLSSGSEKRIEMRIIGKETELDKGIVDALSEPLVHLVRNAVDHGIEPSAVRESQGKPEEGTLSIRAYHEAAQIVIEVSDDGGGIDTEKLRRKAAEKGLFTQEETAAMTDREAMELIFHSGMSTAEKVTEISGRGVGMDAVKSAVEGMKGSIDMESIPGKGTTFRLRLPLTLAVIRGLLVEVRDRVYAIPVSSIREVKRVAADELTSINGKETLLLRDQIISIIRLEDLFGQGRRETDKKYVLVLAFGARQVGLLVDRLIGQQELVIKPVDNTYVNEELVAGGSILGDGRVIFILDAPGIFRKALEHEKMVRAV